MATATASSNAGPVTGRAPQHNSASFLFIADLHLGEGCNTSSHGWDPRDTSCYSVKHLSQTVQHINTVLLPALTAVELVVVGGDITSSAQSAEFIAAKAELDKLTVPYICIMGNHDMWAYESAVGDSTPHPGGDASFARTFAPSFGRLSAALTSYDNASVHNPEQNISSTFQSWELDLAAVHPAFTGMVMLAPDFNTREKALPPCPGNSPVGGCGVPGNAALHDFPGGAFPWFEARVMALTPEAKTVILLSHQPFRCRPGVPDWYFCFAKDDAAKVRAAVERRFGKGRPGPFWGVLAGHQHRWYNGTAFDADGWGSFRQWENSAVKGDALDHEMANSIASFEVVSGTFVAVNRFWTENGTWVNRTDAV